MTEKQKWYSPGQVYLIRSANNLYKIGCSVEVSKRLRDLRAASPVELFLEHSIEWDNRHALETALHQKFSEEHKHGEWFALSKEQVRWIQSLDRDNIELTFSFQHGEEIIRIKKLDK